MSRSRNIKPGFFKNEALADLPFEFRILFQGLWCEANRDGRMEDRPKRLKAEIFPYDAVDVDAGLNALQAAGFIVRYAVTGTSYVEVLNFAKHQNPHKKETAGSIPAPSAADPVPVPDIPEQAENVIGKPGTSPADSLIPDSGFSDSLIPEEEQQHVQPSAAPSRFIEFWMTYPNKKGRKAAEAIWKRRKLDSRCDELIAHVRTMQATDVDWLRGCAPMGSTYLNGDRWEDVPKLPLSPVLAKHGNFEQRAYGTGGAL